MSAPGIVWITGAGSGIGRALAIRYLRAGAIVAGGKGSLPVPGDAGPCQCACGINTVRGGRMWCVGDGERGFALLAGAGELMESFGGPAFTAWRREAIEVAVPLGRDTLERSWAEDELRAAETFGGTRFRAFALRAGNGGVLVRAGGADAPRGRLAARAGRGPTRAPGSGPWPAGSARGRDPAPRAGGCSNPAPAPPTRRPPVRPVLQLESASAGARPGPGPAPPASAPGRGATRAAPSGAPAFHPTTKWR